MNTRKKRLLSHLLILCMVLSLMPAMSMTAYAATNYDVWVGGTQVTSDNLSGPGWTYTPAAGGDDAILTLSGPNTINGVANTQYGAGIYANEALTIYLSADANITVDAGVEAIGDDSISIAVVCTGDLSIQGSGALTANGENIIDGIGATTGGIASVSLAVSRTVNVTANGGNATTASSISFGVGGYSLTDYGSGPITEFGGASVTVSGGSLTAKGGEAKQVSTGVNGESRSVCLTVTAGTVTASAIGSATGSATVRAIYSGNVITAGTVKAGDDSSSASEVSFTSGNTLSQKYVNISFPVVDYPVWIAGVRLTSENVGSDGAVTGMTGITAGTVTYTPAVGETAAILTLNGATITGVDIGLKIAPGTKVVLKNNNTVTATRSDDYSTSKGIQIGENDGDTTTTTFEGDGSLTVNADDYAIMSYCHLTLSATGTIQANGTAGNGISISNKGNMKVTSGILNSTGKDCGIIVGQGSYEQTDGTVTVTATNGSAARFKNDANISGGELTLCGNLAVEEGSIIATEATIKTNTIAESGEGPYNPFDIYDYKWINIKFPVTYPVWVGGVQLTSENVGSDGAVTGMTGVKYTPATNGTAAILALNNATLTSGVSTSLQGYAAIYTTADLTLTLAGSNTVNDTRADEESGTGVIYCTGDAPHLTVREATPNNGAALHVTCASFDNGIFLDNTANMTLESGAVTVSGKQDGVFMRGAGTLTVNGGSLSASGTAEGSSGIYSYGSYGSVFKINGGTVIASGNPFAIFDSTDISGYTDVAVKAGATKAAADAAGYIESPVDTTYTDNKYVWIGSRSVTPPPSTGGGGSYIPTPTIKITDDEDNQSGGSAKYDLIKNNVVITPAEGFKIKNVLLNGKSMGPVTELENVYGWQTVEVIFEKKETEVLGPTTSKQELIKKLKSINLKAKSKLSTLRGKTAVRLVWTVENAEGLDFDGFVIFRSTDTRFSGYGTEPIFTTENMHYYNTKDLEPGHTYYYKVQGYVIKNNEKILTPWSTKAWRTI